MSGLESPMQILKNHNFTNSKGNLDTSVHLPQPSAKDISHQRNNSTVVKSKEQAKSLDVSMLAKTKTNRPTTQANFRPQKVSSKF